MREIITISPINSTAKTTVTTALASLAGNAVLCDLDADAPGLHLLLEAENREETPFLSGHEAIIRAEDCAHCATCLNECRFGAVDFGLDGYAINPSRCEGCKLCVELCPAKAIDFPEKECGHWLMSETDHGTMVHGRLAPGKDSSPGLVALLKEQARSLGESQGADYLICDGAPGVGNLAAASLDGASLVVGVTEPSPSAVLDLKEMAKLCRENGAELVVLATKWDINNEVADALETVCDEKGLRIIGRLPYDEAEAGTKVVAAWGEITSILANGDN